MNKPLLIEIGVEELPAIPFLKELKNIKKKWSDILDKNKLSCEFEFFYTPRKLVLWHKTFTLSQEDTCVEMFGAPISIAYKDGKATGAALGFAKKCGVDLNALETKKMPKGEVLYFKQEKKGLLSKDLLNDMINEFISSLNFGKTMRWANRKDSFIRPIRNLAILLGDEVINATLFGVKSSNNTYVHRMVSFKPLSINDGNDYFKILEDGAIILNQTQRKELILEQIKQIENKHNITVELDKTLLDEIVCITEYPTALVGSFDEAFLELPKEVIITSMKEHQRYFAVYKNDILTNNFIVVSNAKTQDFSLIIAGNEKVLKPRLADAMFFYKNDLKTGLNNEGLKKVLFVDGLGSMYEKLQREDKIAQYLAKIYKIEDITLLSKAVFLSKADLMSEMVYEFTELQGLMAYYYAKGAGEEKEVYIALKEQYLPDAKDAQLPTSVFSSIVALSYKLDTLMGLFSINKIPTGSKDPFALRRAALGIVKICIAHNLEFNLSNLIDTLGSSYKGLDKKLLLDFFNERLFTIFDVNPSVLKAVLKSGELDILNISKKINALNPVVLDPLFKKYSSTFKRLANIIKDINTNEHLKLDENLFEDEAEKTLYKKYTQITNMKFKTYEEELEALFALKPYLDDFFDKVFVNHENQEIKINRKNLIAMIYNAFRNIADIKEITV